MKVIYDFGSNNGDDIPYYLLKADRVVAVEANPLLCEKIRARFATALADGRLIVENCVVTRNISSESVPFYIHRTDHVLSQFDAPTNGRQIEFEMVHLRSQTASQIVHSHGDPFYIKIDVEGYDSEILRELFENGIRPPYISSECHDISVFALLLSIGEYEAFKLVDGASVSRSYSDYPISTLDGTLKDISFPFHSAGPFGPDVKGPWMTANNFFRYLAYENLGWKDIHASKIDKPDATAAVRIRPYFERALKNKIKAFLKRPFESLRKQDS